MPFGLFDPHTEAEKWPASARLHPEVTGAEPVDTYGGRNTLSRNRIGQRVVHTEYTFCVRCGETTAFPAGVTTADGLSEVRTCAAHLIYDGAT